MSGCGQQLQVVGLARPIRRGIATPVIRVRFDIFAAVVEHRQIQHRPDTVDTTRSDGAPGNLLQAVPLHRKLQVQQHLQLSVVELRPDIRIDEGPCREIRPDLAGEEQCLDLLQGLRRLDDLVVNTDRVDIQALEQPLEAILLPGRQLAGPGKIAVQNREQLLRFVGCRYAKVLIAAGRKPIIM